ncbi:hypothetical protein EFBL_0834 [Effusibacillus lacus]|uniref:Uncharacterized protein n=1 Tax=Effusibacillus lacus TaxID=1348429 RepID=A0A292YJ87_9BACL|nr:hypothetical protein EFBL_0834 [Effusibacillus lacus]
MPLSRTAYSLTGTECRYREPPAGLPALSAAIANHLLAYRHLVPQSQTAYSLTGTECRYREPPTGLPALSAAIWMGRLINGTNAI